MSDFGYDDGNQGGSTSTVLILSSCSLGMLIVLYIFWTMNQKRTKPTSLTTSTPPTTTSTASTSTTASTTTAKSTTPEGSKVVLGQACKQSKDCNKGVCCGKAGSSGVCLATCEGGRTGECEFKYTGNSQCDTSKVAGKTKPPAAGTKTCKQAKDCDTNVCCGLPGKTGYCANSCEGTGMCRFKYIGNSVCK